VLGHNIPDHRPEYTSDLRLVVFLHEKTGSFSRVELRESGADREERSKSNGVPVFEIARKQEGLEGRIENRIVVGLGGAGCEVGGHHIRENGERARDGDAYVNTAA